MLEDKVKGLIELGAWLRVEIPQINKEGKSGELAKVVGDLHLRNGWFTPESVVLALTAIADNLEADVLSNWVQKYKEKEASSKAKNVGIIMAGNIPLVGFHDLLCVYLSGHKVLAKTSSDDDVLLPLLVRQWAKLDPTVSEHIEFCNESFPQKIEAVIATGSNNSGRYFDYYFSKYPNIIRKNRTSIAVLNGRETKEELQKLGADIFTYYGLGCRNVSKLFVPEGYSFEDFFEAIFEFKDVINNKKYANNYEYNRTIFLMNSEKLLDNNFLLLKEDIGMFSPIGVLFTETYKTPQELQQRLRADKNSIQCIVSKVKIESWDTVDFGKTQRPALDDYADGVDTFKFALSL